MAKQRFGINDAYRGTVGTVIGYEWRGKWCLRARPLRVRNPRTEKQQSNRMVFKQAVALAGTMKLALRKGLHNVSMGLHITECNLFVKRNKECFSLGEDGNLEVAWESLMLSEGSLAAPVFSTHSSVSPSRAASSPLPGPEGDMACDRSGANLGEQPVSNGADRDGGSWSSSPKLGEGDRREAVVEECVRNNRESQSDITFPFSPCGEGEKACGDDEVYVYAYCPEVSEGVLSAPAWRRGGSVRLTLPERWQGKEVHFYGFAVDLDGEASETIYIGMLERSDTRPRQPQAAASDGGSSSSSPLPGSKGDTACDRSGANLGDSYPALQDSTYTASDTNSHSAVENNFWRQSCSWNLSCIFAT